MAKLYFKYGAMNCGKTTSLLQTHHNYVSLGYNVILMKPVIDTKGNDEVVSRLGISHKVDILLNKNDNPYEIIKKTNNVHCVLVDEVQFLSKEQVDNLYKITALLNIPVICFGLRTDFLGEGFKGSTRLLEIADSISEMKNICKCGKKATMNLRLVNGIPTFSGSQVMIDGTDNIEYISVCSECFLKAKEKEK